MPVDIVVGGQAGDEGKGKISAYLAYKNRYDYCIKVGGPNAGHTVFYKNKIFALRTIPSGFVNQKSKLVLGAGTYLIIDWFFKEMKETGTQDRIIMDPHTVIIEEKHIEMERSDSRIMKSIGSVGTGLGAAIRERIERKRIKFAKDEPVLKKFVKNVPEILNNALEKNKNVLLEGTQGLKLSLLHGEYPFVTSRDTTASTFLAETGLGPRYARDIYAIFKPYVTRTGPGPIKDEVTDREILHVHHTKGREVGSVSGRLRRIGAFEKETAVKTIMINSATKIAVTHIDIFEGNSGIKHPCRFVPKAKKFIKEIESLSKIYPYPKLALISYGPGLLNVIDMRKSE
ncbi:MAG: adenylosuccinate synthetase [Elusimicrobia bacterium]|nr:adenylosuccinate synthetase [Elusimicrobiota bacterium]